MVNETNSLILSTLLRSCSMANGLLHSQTSFHLCMQECRDYFPSFSPLCSPPMPTRMSPIDTCAITFKHRRNMEDKISEVSKKASSPWLRTRNSHTLTTTALTPELCTRKCVVFDEHLIQFSTTISYCIKNIPTFYMSTGMSKHTKITLVHLR